MPLPVLDDEIADLCAAEPRFAWLVGRARFAACSLEFRVCLRQQLQHILTDAKKIFGPASTGNPDPSLKSQQALDRARAILQTLFQPGQCHPLCPCRLDLQAWALEKDHRWRLAERQKAKKRAQRANFGQAPGALKEDSVIGSEQPLNEQAKQKQQSRLVI